MEQKRYTVVDLVKFVSAIFIISIHTQPLENINKEISFVLEDILGRMAVPFFLVCSGYFIGKSSKNTGEIFLPNKEYLKRQFIKILKLYVGWSLVYFPIVVYNWNKIGWFSAFAFVDWIIGFFTRGSYYHLWYLISLLYAIPLVYFIMRMVKKKYYSIIIVVLYAIQVIVYAYNFTVSDFIPNILKICNYFACIFIAITRVLPFLLLGIMIAQENKGKNTVKMFLINFVCLVIEAYALRVNNKETVSYIFFTLPTSYYFFKTILEVEKNIHIRSFEVFRASTFLYCVHPIFVWVFLEFFKFKKDIIFCLTIILSLATWKIIEGFGRMRNTQ